MGIDYSEPAFIGVACALALSVIVNVILVTILARQHRKRAAASILAVCPNPFEASALAFLFIFW